MNDSIIKADIFFLIASLGTITLTIFISIFLYYLIKAVKNLEKVSEILVGGIGDSKEFAIELKERLENNIIFKMLFPLRSRRIHKNDK